MPDSNKITLFFLFKVLAVWWREGMVICFSVVKEVAFGVVGKGD